MASDGTYTGLPLQIKYDLTEEQPRLWINYAGSGENPFDTWLTVTYPNRKTVNYGNFQSPILSLGASSTSIIPLKDLKGQLYDGLYTFTIFRKEGTATYEAIQSVNYQTLQPEELQLQPHIDVLSPELKVEDVTDYQQEGYTSSTQRHFTALLENIPGTLQSTDKVFDLEKDGGYYHTAYSLSLTATTTYTSKSVPWFQIETQKQKTIEL